MAVSEERRLELYRSIEDAHGPRVAATMMEYLPPVGWGDVARQGDMDLLRRDVRGDMDLLRRDMETGFDQIRKEMRSESGRLELRMDSGFNQLRAEMHEGFGAVRTDFAAIIAAQTRSMVLMVLGSVFTVAALAFATAWAR